MPELLSAWTAHQTSSDRDSIIEASTHALDWCGLAAPAGVEPRPTAAAPGSWAILASPLEAQALSTALEAQGCVQQIASHLRELQAIVAAAETHGKAVSLCGELASQPIGALALLSIGYRALSLTPSALGAVKALLLDLDLKKAATMLQPLVDSPAGSVSIREKLSAFAGAEGLQL